MLGPKSLEQLKNREHKLVQIQILESIGFIKICSRFKNIQAAKRRVQKLPGSTDQNTDLQNFKFGSTTIQAQKGLGFQIYFSQYIKETLSTFFIRLFRERRECLFCIQGFVPKKLSHIFYWCCYLKNLKIRYCRSYCLLQSSKVLMI